MTLVQKLKDKEWLTQTAVLLLTANPAGVAVQLAKTLTRDPDLGQELVDCFCSAMVQASGADLALKLKPEDWRQLDLASLNPMFPSQHPLFRVALEGLKQAASTTFGDPIALERRVRQEFAQAFYATVRGSGSPKLREYLYEFRKDNDLPEGQLMEHTNQVLASVNDPLSIDPTTTLRQVYVAPGAKYQHVIGEEREQKKASEVSLMPHLAQVLLKTTEPVVIHGQPGHGKSSAMRMLIHAARAAQEPGDQPLTLLFLEFKNLGQLNRNELTIIRERCPFIKEESFFYDRNTLLILDGMDERQVTENADSDLKEFLRLMMAVAGKVNKRVGSRLNLVVTGRSQFFQGVRSAFERYHVFELLDFDKDRIVQWLATFNQRKELSEAWTYEKLVACQFKELLGQPILLTMLGLLISDPSNDGLISSMGQVNRAKVYETIIQWTYRKRWHQDKKPSEIEEKYFFELLQAVAFCMFCRGSENIRLSDLKEDLEKHKDLLELNLPDPSRLETLCRDLAISFFFKGLEDKAFSFIHKSFGDFLLVRAMFETLQRLERVPAKYRVRELYSLFGRRPLSSEDHYPFMQEMATNARTESARLVAPMKEFFLEAQSHHCLMQHGQGLGENPVATEATVLSGALTWLVVCNQVQEHPELHLVFCNRRDFEQYLGLLMAVPMATIKAFSFLDLKGAWVERADLFRSFFSGADLSSANLVSANLSGADLEGVNLKGTILQGASFLNANLASANLEGAYPKGANFQGANLKEANLQDVKLAGANLQGANLKGADLMRADFQNARLTGANLHLVINWQLATGLETALFDHVLDPPEGFLRHVERLRARANERVPSKERKARSD